MRKIIKRCMEYPIIFTLPDYNETNEKISIF
jgi:hypothetical protein